MWINLTDDERGVLASCLQRAGIAGSDDLIERLKASPDPSDADFISAASEKHEFGSDGDVDIDENAVVSRSDDGAYVMAWLWVSNEDAGLSDENEDFSVERIPGPVERWRSIFPKRLEHHNAEHATFQEAHDHIAEHEDDEDFTCDECNGVWTVDHKTEDGCCRECQQKREQKENTNV